MHRLPRRLRLGMATAALLGAFGPAHALNVLLVNDDGCKAPGIVAVQQELLKAGHKVIVVAPNGNQSGSGGAYAVPDRSTNLVTQDLNGDGSVYCVHRVKPAFVAGGALDSTNPNYIGTGSPVDATAMGLKIIGPEKNFTPDVVVSGANFGENLSDSIPHSGTVMNALFAARRGVPAIAISVGVKFSEATTGFGSTFASFPRAGAFVARLLAKLDSLRKPGDPLFPVLQPLSINYPALAASENAAGVRISTTGTVDSFSTAYKREAGNIVSVNVGAPQAEQAALAAIAETPAFMAKYVTISPLAVDFRPTPLTRGQFARTRGDLAKVAP